MVGVSYDSEADNRAFREKFGFPYDLLSDVDGAMSTAYGVSEPDSQRSPRKSVLVGPDGRVAMAYGTVKPDAHPGQVLADIERLS